MKKIQLFIAAFMLIIPFSACAQLLIQSHADIPERIRSRMESTQRTQKPKQPLPSFEKLKEDIEQARMFLANQPPGMPEPLTHPMLVQHGCDLVAKAPSGVERKAGGLHGIGALYQCRDAYLQVYEYDYTKPMTQGESVFDDDYAHDPVAHRYTVKAFRTERDGRTRTALRWINPDYQIIFEVYPDHDSKAVIDAYREMIRTTAMLLLR